MHASYLHTSWTNTNMAYNLQFYMQTRSEELLTCTYFLDSQTYVLVVHVSI